MNTTTISHPDVNNEWRTATPGAEGWIRSPRPEASLLRHESRT